MIDQCWIWWRIAWAGIAPRSRHCSLLRKLDEDDRDAEQSQDR
jgi:hypothetical protein